MALAGLSVASVSRTRWRSALQRHSDQPLLGPDIRILRQQVNPLQRASSAHPTASSPHFYLLALPSRFGSDPSRYVVRVGGSEQTFTLEQVVVHRKFKGQSGGHDLALLKLPSTKGHCVSFEHNTNAACLPPADTGANTPSSCVVIVTAGWTGAGTCLLII